jgi:hypothetical protein
MGILEMSRPIFVKELFNIMGIDRFVTNKNVSTGLIEIMVFVDINNDKSLTAADADGIKERVKRIETLLEKIFSKERVGKPLTRKENETFFMLCFSEKDFMESELGFDDVLLAIYTTAKTRTKSDALGLFRKKFEK